MLAWLASEGASRSGVPGMDMLVLIATISPLTILVPLLLLQMALRKADELTMMICLSAQPALTYLLASFLPA